jgi:dephospho-CoA kinase
MPDSRVLNHNLHILLGGGIGAGKGAAGHRFGMLGATVVEADRIGHALLEPGEAVADAVAQRWPGVVVGGTIDRASLARIVFADADALAELERMTHPHIVRRISELAQRHRDLVVEVPVLLAPAGNWTRVLVRAPASVRRARAVARGGIPDDIDRRMARQASRDAWMNWADEIIDNAGTLDELHQQVDALWRRLKTIDTEDTSA